MTSMDDSKPAVCVLGAVVEVLELVVEDDCFAGVARVVLLGRMAVTVVVDRVEGGEVPPVVVIEETEKVVPPPGPEAQPAVARTTTSAQPSSKAPTNLRIALPCCCQRSQPGQETA
jgi:hypothetical protein